jgi:signal transduction histidine kinase
VLHQPLEPLPGPGGHGAYAGFQFFAYGAAAIAEREARSRRELARVNAELQAMQELLQGATRLAERVRIAREIHDAVGHHLTALSLNLEVAANLAEGLAEGLPTPRVRLSIPDGLEVRDPALAHTVFRCVQEAVKNAVRHSGAKNLWIGVEWGPHGLEVTAADDGCGAEGPSLGNGLRGMRERLERLGGTLELDTAPRAGFKLRALLPIASEAP